MVNIERQIGTPEALLIEVKGTRLMYEDNWLVHGAGGFWFVFTKPPYKKKLRCLYEGNSLVDAMNVLIRIDDGEE